MRSILTKVSLLLTLFEIVLASVLELRGEKSPVLPDGFHCGDAIFTGNFLKEVTDEVKRKYRFGIFYSEKLSKSYSGPPFTRPYLAWPISHETKSYKKGKTILCYICINRLFKHFFDKLQQCRDLIEQ